MSWRHISIVAEVNFTQGGTFKGEQPPLLINKLVLERQDTDIDAVFEFRCKFFLHTYSKMGFYNYLGEKSPTFMCFSLNTHFLGKLWAWFNVSTNYKLCIIIFL